MNQRVMTMASAILAVACVPAPAAAPGSAAAAEEVVPQFLGKLYTIVEPAILDGDRATVKAKMLDLHCIFVLKRRATANSTGWVVERVDCQKG